MNPLYDVMQGSQQSGMNNLMQQFLQFKQNFKGDPQQQVQQLLNSGQVSQEQYNNAVQMANQFKNLLGM